MGAGFSVSGYVSYFGAVGLSVSGCVSEASTKTEAQTDVSTEMDTGTEEQAELQSQTEGKSQTRPQPEVKDVRNGDLLGPLSLKGAYKYGVYGYVKRFYNHSG